MNKLTDTFELYNGVQVPCVGYGTYLTPDGEIAKNSVMEAIKVACKIIAFQKLGFLAAHAVQQKLKNFAFFEQGHFLF